MSHDSGARDIIEPPRAFVIACAIISLSLLSLLSFLVVSQGSTASLKHILAIALSPVATFVAVIVAVFGWDEVARRNGEQARKTEIAKQDHARQGTLRQVRTLLRDTIRTCKPFFNTKAELRIDDFERNYRRFLDRLNERATAIDLKDNEYDALDAYVTGLGELTELLQSLAESPPFIDVWDNDPENQIEISIEPPIIVPRYGIEEPLKYPPQYSELMLSRERQSLDERRIVILILVLQHAMKKMKEALLLFADPEMHKNYDSLKAPKTYAILSKRIRKEAEAVGDWSPQFSERIEKYADAFSRVIPKHA